MLDEKKVAGAWSPGHVTGFFEIHDKDPDWAKRGSRGAGVCLRHGVINVVEVEPADRQEIVVYINKEPHEAPVTTAAVSNLLQAAVMDARVGYDRDGPKGERAKARVTVHADVQLPVSQGFGMSAAGALAATLGLGKALRMGRSDAIRAAHFAEIKHKSGLGDVVASTVGGFEIRSRPGIPPWGNLRSFLGYGEVVLCTVGGELSTKSVLSDRETRKRINATGGALLDEFLKAPSMEGFFDASWRFAEDTGLLTPELREAADAASQYGRVAMSMLGHSLFCVGRSDTLAEVLEDYGDVIVTEVAPEGAHPLDVEIEKPHSA